MPSPLNYEQLYASFRWNIPERYNIAADVCDRHAADPGKVALIGDGRDGKTWQMTFRDVQRKANQLANLLVSLGLVKGDRVMLLLGQNAWTAIGHVACWKAGLISVPASTLVRRRRDRLPAQCRRGARSSSPIWPICRRWSRHEHSHPTRGARLPDRWRGAECALRLPGRARSRARQLSTMSIPLPTTRPFSISPRARPAIRKARCRRIARCSDTCRASSWAWISFRSRATACGRRPTGHGWRA